MNRMILIFFGLLPMCLGVWLESNLPHDYLDCPEPANAKVLAYTKQVKKAGKFLSYIEESVVFPENGVSKLKISCIMVKDKSSNGKGGYATSVDGDVGGYSAKVNLRSQLGQELFFSVAIYTLDK